jgi:acyl-CoA synthetase (NDP forming)
VTATAFEEEIRAKAAAMSDPKSIYIVGAKTKRRKENTTKMGLERGGSGFVYLR